MTVPDTVLTSSPTFAYKVRVQGFGSVENYWVWCNENVQLGTWKVMLGFFSNSSETYCFIHAEDAVAFTLRFGL